MALEDTVGHLPLRLTREARPGFQALLVTHRQLHHLISDNMVTDDIVYAAVGAFTAALSGDVTHALINPLSYGDWITNPADMHKIFNSARASDFWRSRNIIMPLFHDVHWMALHASLDEATINIYDSFASEGQVEPHGGVRACSWRATQQHEC